MPAKGKGKNGPGRAVPKRAAVAPAPPLEAPYARIVREAKGKIMQEALGRDEGS